LYGFTVRTKPLAAVSNIGVPAFTVVRGGSVEIPKWQRALCKGNSDDLSQALLERWWLLAEENRRTEFADVIHAAAIAGVAPRTLLDWINQGLVASLPIGRKHRVYLPSLKAFLAQRADAWVSGEEPLLRASKGQEMNARQSTGNSRG